MLREEDVVFYLRNIELFKLMIAKLLKEVVREFKKEEENLKNL